MMKPEFANQSIRQYVNRSRRISILILGFFLLLSINGWTQTSVKKDARLLPLQVDDSGHFLITADGEPFFWMGDTAWKLVGNATPSEAKTYLEKRASQGFNVIQACFIFENLRLENGSGDLPFTNLRTLKPNEDYWTAVDSVVTWAADLGIYVAILPMWARAHIEPVRGKPEDKVFAQDSIDLPYAYGHFLGSRYTDETHLIWILGGDEWGYQDTIYHQMAKGIVDGSGKQDFADVLMSYHPQGGTYRPPATSSSEFYANKKWMDFNMIQSGHNIGNRNFERIAKDYALLPPKPTIESEPCYEGHPVMHDFNKGEFGPWHLRRRGYWSVLAGGFGYTYGANGIWQVAKESRKGPKNFFKYYWQEAIDFEGANDMIHLRKLFESRPFITPTRIPDQGIFIDLDKDSTDLHAQAARASDHSYWILYFTSGQTMKIFLPDEGHKKYKAWWYNPRDGKVYNPDQQETNKWFCKIKKGKTITIDPPGEVGDDNDWILVLDHDKTNYGVPGK